MRWLILLHRYIGIAVGWLLVAWCLSGVVMMYMAYPEVTFEEHLEALPELDLGRCCARIPASVYDGNAPVVDFSLEMLADRPVLRLTSPFGQNTAVDLTTGREIAAIDSAAARQIAAQLEPARAADLTYLGTLERDQWTVTANFDRDRPLHRFALGDPADTQWYISSASGQLVQATTGRERFWNWAGAVTHWLYPSLLRRNGPLWSQVVIWSTVIGLFLTSFGVYIGISQLRRRRNGRLSPYRGVALWHHYLGLAFGVLTLTWLGSGLLSMNPWGLLSGSGARFEIATLQDYGGTFADVERAITIAPEAGLPAGIKRIESAPFRGRPYLVAYDAKGEGRRYAAATFEPAALGQDELAAAAKALATEHGLASAELLSEGDAYYFDHHVTRPFPVYRAIAADPESTRYYLDATTGQLVGKFDTNRRWYRWLFEGLHRLDFAAPLRQRPIWDLLMLTLLAGVTGVCVTGTYMGIHFLFR